jgi:hypothetical protein
MPKVYGSVMPCAIAILFLVVLTACAQVPGSLESERITQRFYISPTGNNANPGTLSQPFRTIQKCASVATPGTACLIRAGTYRETIRPTASGQAGLPIVFKPYNNETVVISGTDIVQNWSMDSGSIYKASLNWDLGSGSNQVFVNGKMMTEARYPNVGTDMFSPWGKFVNPRGSNVTYTVDADNLPAGLSGANINFLPGPEWVVETGRVTSSTTTSFTFTSPNGQMTEIPDFNPELYVPRNGNPYFIWGKRILLDSAGEWFLENDKLFLWPENNRDPNTQRIEVKRRYFAFDLTDRSNILIEGIHLFAANLTTADISKSPDQATAKNINLRNIHVRYPSHYINVAPGTSWEKGIRDSGVILFGRNHSLVNSTIAFSAGNGVTLAGQNHEVSNNIIRDVGYTVTDTSAINTGWYGYSSRDHRIQYNTLYNTGRSVLVHRNTQALKILNNHMYNAGLLSNDLGMTYTFQADGGGTEIAYNLVHDNFAPSESMGIYLDNGAKNFIVHHNIIYNLKAALNLNLPSINNRIYNNTLIGFNESVNSGAARVADCNATGTKLINNIFAADFSLGFVFDGTACPNGIGIPEFSNNLESDINPLFADSINANFSLNSGSPAINTGRVLSPYTDGYIGSAPDKGALERGLAPFKVGASITEACVYGDSCIPKPTLRYGVMAEYFSDQTLTTLSNKRLGSGFNFGYYGETDIPPGSFLPNGTNYSARWTAFLKAPITGRYTFTLTADDGARLWLNNIQRINRWDYQDPPVNTFSVNLQAGQYYPIKLEMHQDAGGGAAFLEWSYPGQSQQGIPVRYLSLNKP